MAQEYVVVEPRGDDAGRVAVPEVAELLHLQRPAAAVAAVGVVLLGLLLALVAPAAVPASPLVGAVVGVLAVIAAVVVAIVLDGRDPVLRGPRHLRRDGYAVLARMSGPDPELHGGPVLDALLRRLAERDHLSLVLAGTGADPSALARVLGHGAAGEGHTSLVVDLRAAGAPGVADVGAGTVRLGEAAQLAADRPFAWIGAGADRVAAVAAAAGVARRPPRDLELLVVVAPEAATHAPDLLQACDRTVLLVTADTQQRAMVAARLDALERSGGRPEAVVVGGVNMADEVGIDTTVPDEPFAEPTSGVTTRIAPLPAYGHVADDVEGDVENDVEDADGDDVAGDGATEEAVVEPWDEVAPEPPAAPVDRSTFGRPVVLPPPLPSDAATGPTVPTAPQPAAPEPPDAEPSDDETNAEAVAPAAVSPPPPTPTPDEDPVTVVHDIDAVQQAGDEDVAPDEADLADRLRSALEDTGPITPVAPVQFRTTSVEVDADGFAEDDPLRTTAAVHQLLAGWRDD